MSLLFLLHANAEIWMDSVAFLIKVCVASPWHSPWCVSNENSVSQMEISVVLCRSVRPTSPPSFVIWLTSFYSVISLTNLQNALIHIMVVTRVAAERLLQNRILILCVVQINSVADSSLVSSYQTLWIVTCRHKKTTPCEQDSNPFIFFLISLWIFTNDCFFLFSPP